MTMGRKIRQYLAQPRYRYKGQSLQLTVSIGRTSLRSDETLQPCQAKRTQPRLLRPQPTRPCLIPTSARPAVLVTTVAWPTRAPPAVLQALPAELRNAACLCPRCARVDEQLRQQAPSA